ncbi:MAG: hypothetical protein HRT58_01025 [Crocinitomicaceae bacterium]|nr:hypothetical protein [Flavobacteriales bacterium]NQZ34204.1 hypothetical protein [Crocinitomicaceae bacterium]
MSKKVKELPVLLPTKGNVRYFLRALYSLTNFVKASVVSISIILVILILLTQMEQAFTMLLRMIETGRISLLLCFILINLLAVSLSHYPIYTYYAGNINQSRKYVEWKKERPFAVKWLKWVAVYTFKPINNKDYVKDIYANILRQFLGLYVYLVWAIFIYYTYLPNLTYSLGTVGIALIQWGSVFLALLAFFSYAYYKRKLSPLHSTVAIRSAIYKKIGICYFFSCTLSFVLIVLVIFKGNLFNPGGLILLLLTNFMMMLNFSFFRLVRPRLRHVLRSLKNDGLRNSTAFLYVLRRIEKSSNYLVVFVIAFYSALLSIIYFTIASINGWPLPNGIVIVMIYLYFYFFIISSIGKYYFVKYSMAQKEKEAGEVITTLNSRTFRYMTSILILLGGLLFLGLFTESHLNELTIYPVDKNDDGIVFSEFEDRVKAMPDTVFFISSHGGGLKANAWTLMVLDKLQKSSNNQLMSQTVAMSGASGGSLGLALFGSIHSQFGNQPEKLKSVISKITYDNYASVDISMLFGADFARIFYPLNKISSSHDRSYYGMLMYQRNLGKEGTKLLDTTSYRRYWKELGTKKQALPALIMNTASTNGKRGIFYSINTTMFDSIFPYSQNLSDLKMANGNDGSISFLQAVSTTNRFPIFSPVAKIKGAGHFIDAGAIDNSGILGCWDLYLYLFDRGVLKNKTIVFVDIDNSKSSYAEMLLDQFLEETKRTDFLIDENEKSSIGANLQTGLSLNKIPGYLNDFLSNYTSKKDHLEYKRIVLPHKVSISDIEGVIDGAFCNFPGGNFREELTKFLDKHNAQILKSTESKKGFFQDWDCYEPVLSRQLSYSNITYFDRIISSNFTRIDAVSSFFE